jgi:hypothetical protein
MTLLADAVNDLFGGITPPEAMDIGGSEPAQGLATFIGFGIRVFIIIAGLALLIYLLWGAFDWITSGGEKEKISKAQGKITNAVVGIIIIFVVLVVFNLLAGNILGIIVPTENGFQLKLPTLK